MKVIDVKTLSKKYFVYVGKNIFTDVIKKVLDRLNPDRVLIIKDPKVVLEVKLNLQSGNILIEKAISEEKKNIKTVLEIIELCLQKNISRSSIFVNIGGGALTDTAAFAASLYMRGIRFINVPTTLLAMVDASVGGKTGVNFQGVKNIIGTFSQPEAVIVDTKFLKTLPKRQFVSGWAEIIKHGLIKDLDYFQALEEKKLSLEDVIFHSIKIKKEVVQKDEKESKGIRKILNFGHTIGHSLEVLSYQSKNPLLHGEAIALGMVAEAWMSYKKGYLRIEDLERIKKILSFYNLPVKLPFKFKVEEFVDKIKKDKKNKAGEIRVVLLKRLGQAVFDCPIDEKLAVESLKVL